MIKREKLSLESGSACNNRHPIPTAAHICLQSSFHIKRFLGNAHLPKPTKRNLPGQESVAKVTESGKLILNSETVMTTKK